MNKSRDCVQTVFFDERYHEIPVFENLRVDCNPYLFLQENVKELTAVFDFLRCNIEFLPAVAFPHNKNSMKCGVSPACALSQNEAKTENSKFTLLTQPLGSNIYVLFLLVSYQNKTGSSSLHFRNDLI